MLAGGGAYRLAASGQRSLTGGRKATFGLSCSMPGGGVGIGGFGYFATAGRIISYYVADPDSVPNS